MDTGAVRAGGHVPPDSLVAPQIQKLTDRSDVISEVPKCSKIQIFRGSAVDPVGGTYNIKYLIDNVTMENSQISVPQTL